MVDNVLWTLFEIAVNIGESIIVFLLLNKHLGCKNKKRIVAITFIPLLALCTTVMNMLNLSFVIVPVIGLLLIVAYSLVFFGRSLTARVIWGITPSIIFLISNFLVSTIMIVITPNGVESLTPSTTVRAEAMLLYTCFNIGMLLILSLFKTKQQSNPPILSILMIISVAAGIFTVSLLVHQSLLITMHNESAKICAVASAIVLMISIGNACLFRYMASLYQRNLDMQAATQQAQLEAEHIKQAETMYNFVKEWRHDTKSTISTLMSLAERNDCDNIIKCLQEMDSAVQQTTIIVSTGNPAVDATISSKLITAQNNGIHVNTILAVSENIAINVLDLCAVISNFLDNAIEATINLPEDMRIIDFSMSFSGKMLNIHVRNDASGNYSYKDEELTTTKDDKSDHGIGLKRIKKIAAKYNGSIVLKPQAK